MGRTFFVDLDRDTRRGYCLSAYDTYGHPGPIKTRAEIYRGYGTL